MSFAHVVERETLCMGAETEQVQLMALTGVLPVRVKLLSAAGAEPYVQTIQPNQSSGIATASAAAGEMTHDAARGLQQVWLVYRPGHYEVVYPLTGFENVDGSLSVW